jgi:hypothetical protein
VSGIESTRRLTVAALALFAATACASLPPAERAGADWARLAEQPRVRALHYPPPALRIVAQPTEPVSPALANAFCGLTTALGYSGLGGIFLIFTIPPCLVAEGVAQAEAVQAGETLRSRFAVDDPIVHIAEWFISRIGLTNVELVEEPAASDVLETRDPVPEGMAFDFRTTFWQAGVESLEIFLLSYSAEARLISPGERRIVWQGRCYVSGYERVERAAAGFRDYGRWCATNLVEDFLRVTRSHGPPR